MKHFLLCSLFLLLLSTGIGQTKTEKETRKKEVAEKKADKKEDKLEKTAAKQQVKTGKEAAKVSSKSTGFNKDGSPDMRLAANKRKAEEEARKEQEQQAREKEKLSREREQKAKSAINTGRPAAATPARVNNPQPANASGDKVVGTDDKGRTIYEGPRGGHYYINKNGNKTYVKQ